MKITSFSSMITCPTCLTTHETTIQTLFDITRDGSYIGLARCGQVYMVRFDVVDGKCASAVPTGEPVFIPVEQQVYVFTEYIRERISCKLGIKPECISSESSKSYCAFARQMMVKFIQMRFPKIHQVEISRAIGGATNQQHVSYYIKVIAQILSTPSQKWRQRIYNELKEEIFHETTA